MCFIKQFMNLYKMFASQTGGGGGGACRSIEK